ncbi:MAG: tRNA preQ1(34) S-adenosylmethionine ribosyltransferase-isomerase QueA [Nitrospirae bacterium]|nr:tRNA preQ1(34) S-adenosylmethionine ribosyltransferase-isomerase QueA [Nitrospirota bacterium]
MKTADFDFFLPDGFIAERPAEKRDASRLLVLSRDGGIEHRQFSDLPSYLQAGDMLVMNNSRVFPARLTGYKPTGGRIEILLVERLSGTSWQILAKDNYSGPLTIADKYTVHMAEDRTITFADEQEMRVVIEEQGQTPLPPYIKRKADETDRERYQTVYAEKEGSIAAPTAGLHFTEGLLNSLQDRSIAVRMVTLHVGIGTFRPIKAERIRDHNMDREHFEIESSLLHEIAETKQRGNRVVTVGTTTTRTLEGYLSGNSTIHSMNGAIMGSTDIFIHEGFRFRAADALITNFHLPRSTPLMLAAAFCGRKNLLNAYEEAISRGYRFFSYGDAMLVL